MTLLCLVINCPLVFNFKKQDILTSNIYSLQRDKESHRSYLDLSVEFIHNTSSCILEGLVICTIN